MTTETTTSLWPALPAAAWQDTRDTLHLWTQVVGKVRLALAPMVNHWWQVPLYVSARGLTTSLIPHPTDPTGGLELHFDFLRHELNITTVAGERRQVALERRSVASFYDEVMAKLAGVGVEPDLLARPVEIEVAIPFAQDTEHDTYDPDFAHRFWRSLVAVQHVFTGFRGGFVGKASPVQFFWGSFDLAVTRFSGRPAPTHPGGMPNCADWVMHEAYSHEVASVGYWPGGAEEGAFYAYAYPEPDGYRDVEVTPEQASYDHDLAEFVLPYRAVRESAAPEATLTGFLESTYRAAADLAQWDREALEREGTNGT